LLNVAFSCDDARQLYLLSKRSSHSPTDGSQAPKAARQMQETVSAFCCDLRSSSRNGLRGPADAIRQIGVREVTYYRWRLEFSGLKTEHVKRLKDLELENSRLRKAISNLTLDTLILQEAAGGRF